MQDNATYRKQRKDWLDWLKGTAMLLIVISHINAPALYVKIYTPIFLSAFFFSSGYTWNPGKSLKDYLIKKIRTLVIPFLSLGLINTVLACIFEGDPFVERYTNFIVSRCGNWDDLWFISCLMSMSILMYIIHHLSSDYRIVMFAACVCSVLGYYIHRQYGIALPWQFENACIQMPFMALGYCYREKEACFEKFKNWYIIGTSFLVYIVLCIVLISPQVNVHNEYLGNWLVFMLLAWFGTLTYVSAAKVICNYTYFKHFLVHKFVLLCGKLTLVMYAFQSKVIFIINIFGLNKWIPQWLYCIVVGVVAYCIVFIPAYVIENYFSWLLGKGTAFTKPNIQKNLIDRFVL